MQSVKRSACLSLLLLFPGVIHRAEAQSWSFTGSMAQARDFFTATVLSDGEVLIVGGVYKGTFIQFGLTSAEIYNPASGAFRTTGSLNVGRYNHTATLLNNGKVLIAGGMNSNTSLASTELYDPVAGTFTPSANLYCFCTPKPALLANGKVLFAGGYDGAKVVPTAALYDPTSETFMPTGSLNAPRAGNSATLLGNGKVLIAGGGVLSAELYDPAAGTFTLTGSLSAQRSGHTATLLKDGNVLLAAGYGGTYNTDFLSSAELYNPATGNFTVTGSLNTGRIWHTANLLSTGKVLVVGGTDNSHSLSSAELYDPVAGTFSNTASLNTPRSGHASASLINGAVLAVGGLDGFLGRLGWLASAELYR
jgi:hypothetical protein